MVVLAASIISKSGKALVYRQYVDMSRIQIEGCLAAFPKLVGTGKQHSYVETEHVLYVYQPIEYLYLVLVTNKQRNILEDLETLRLLSKLVPEYSYSLDEEGIGKTAFGILFAFDEVILLGHKENVTIAQVKQYCEMYSDQEKMHKLIMRRKSQCVGTTTVEDLSTGQSRAAAPLPRDPITLSIEEKLNVTLKQLRLVIIQELYLKHTPTINTDLYSGENILGLRDPTRPFPSVQGGLCLLKWRMQSADESLLPFSISCWPSVSGNETYVMLEYEAPTFDLQNVVISIPLPALREGPRVQQIDGDFSGSMEFVIPTVDTSELFPIAVRFTSTRTSSNLKVATVLPLKGGNPPKFAQQTMPSAEKYLVF